MPRSVMKFIVLLVLISLVGVACGDDSDSGSTTTTTSGSGSTVTSGPEEATTSTDGEPAPVVLKASSFAWGDPSEVEYWTSVKEALEAENPWITVETGETTAEGYIDSVLIDMLAGNAPDLAWCFDNQIQEWIEKGVLEPLNPWLEEYGIDVSELAAAQQLAIVDGQVYAILVALNPRVLLYNQAILDDAGVDVPTTPDELVAVMEAVKALGTSQFGFATMSASADTNQTFKELLPIVIGFGGNFFVDGQPTATAPETIAALAFIEDIFNRELIPLGQANATYWDEWVHGQVASVIVGTFLMTEARDSAPENFVNMDAALLPFPSGKSVSVNEFLAIPRDAENKDAAFAFIAQTLDPAMQENLVSMMGAIPSSGEVTAAQIAEAPYFEIAAEVAATATPLTPGLAEGTGEALQIITSWYQEMLFTDMTAAEAAAHMQAELEALVAGG